jgi:capsular polysaccharide biosynthesis protein
VQLLLAQEGFETVFLERMAIEDQISLFRDAEFVIGAHGAGLTNLLFCAPGTKVLEFMPAVEMRPFFWLISVGLDLRHAVQFCPSIDGDTFQATLAVDIAKLKTLYKRLDADRVTVSGHRVFD